MVSTEYEVKTSHHKMVEGKINYVLMVVKEPFQLLEFCKKGQEICMFSMIARVSNLR